MNYEVESRKRLLLDLATTRLAMTEPLVLDAKSSLERRRQAAWLLKKEWITGRCPGIVEAPFCAFWLTGFTQAGCVQYATLLGYPIARARHAALRAAATDPLKRAKDVAEQELAVFRATMAPHVQHLSAHQFFLPQLRTTVESHPVSHRVWNTTPTQLTEALGFIHNNGAKYHRLAVNAMNARLTYEAMCARFDDPATSLPAVAPEALFELLAPRPKRGA